MESRYDSDNDQLMAEMYGDTSSVPTSSAPGGRSFLNLLNATQRVYRPRLIVTDKSAKSVARRSRHGSCASDGGGSEDHGGPVGDSGAELHVASALLHRFEHIPVISIDLPSLQGDASSMRPEDSLLRCLQEARRRAPSVLYMPLADAWWTHASAELREALRQGLLLMPPHVPILWATTVQQPLDALPLGLQQLLGLHSRREPGLAVVRVQSPKHDERTDFFRRVIEQALPQAYSLVQRLESADSHTAVVRASSAATISAISQAAPLALSPQKKRKQRVLESLPPAPVPSPKVVGPTPEELKRRAEKDEHALRELRTVMRSTVNELVKQRRLQPFTKPVCIEYAFCHTILHATYAALMDLTCADCHA